METCYLCALAHIRRHSVVVYCTGVKPPPVHIDRPYSLSAMIEYLCAVRVVPTRVCPKSGRIVM
ncbi:hypothetical protein DOS32_25370 [Escherichia coli]|nr:hypothetical protein [Escherichia coli]